MSLAESPNSRGFPFFKDVASVIPGTHRSGFVIRCTECPAADVVACVESRTHAMDHKHIVRQFERAGWYVGTKRKEDLCPQCSRKPKAPPMPADAKIIPALPLAEVPHPPAAQTMDARRRVRHLLDEHFDEAKGRYQKGWSDERVGLEAGLSEQFVAATRVGLWGEIVPEPTLDMAAFNNEWEQARLAFKKADEMTDLAKSHINAGRAALDRMAAIIRKSQSQG